jgi:hypothetical protein
MMVLAGAASAALRFFFHTNEKCGADAGTESTGH